MNAPERLPLPVRDDLEVRRIRFAPRFRMLQVRRVVHVTSGYVRVTLGGEELEGFESASFDDHVKVFFPTFGEERPARPVIGPGGPAFPADAAPVMRDFTPRRYDAPAGELDLEFALHASGPASDWARQARPGQWLGIGGPRGSQVIPMMYDWHLLIGDETALPAIGRRCAELPRGSLVLAIVEVGDPGLRAVFDTPSDTLITWCLRDALRGRGQPLLRALRRTSMPAGEGFIWAAGESATMREVRRHLREERGVDSRRIRVSAYWRDGAQGIHERLED